MTDSKSNGMEYPFLLGVVMALAGIACYDWRAGLIATGLALSYLSVMSFRPAESDTSDPERN